MRAIYDYIEVALWSSVHYEDENSDEIPMDEVDAELAVETLQTMKQELSDFFKEVDAILEKYETESGERPINDQQIAHDFWLTRNGDGTGFWDRSLGELGDKLTEVAKVWGSVDLYIGDDGKIYQQ